MKNKIGKNRFYIGGMVLVLLILTISLASAVWPFTGNAQRNNNKCNSCYSNITLTKSFVMRVNDNVLFYAKNFTLSRIGSSNVTIISNACPGQTVLISNYAQRNCGNYTIKASHIIRGVTGISGFPSADIQLSRIIPIVNGRVQSSLDDGTKVALI